MLVSISWGKISGRGSDFAAVQFENALKRMNPPILVADRIFSPQKKGGKNKKIKNKKEKEKQKANQENPTYAWSFGK